MKTVNITPTPSLLTSFILVVLLSLISPPQQLHASSNTGVNTTANDNSNLFDTLNSSLNSTLNSNSYTEPEFLDLKEAFQGTIELADGQIVVHWNVADGYYLYRTRFGFELSEGTSASLGEPIFSHEGKIKEDELFGTVEVYYHTVTIRLPFTSPVEQKVEVVVKYQGCADAGLCYPPSKLKERLTLAIATSNTASDAAAVTEKSTDRPDEIQSTNKDLNKSIDKDSASSIAHYLESSSLLPILGLFFLLGVGLTFTPCVLPMIPILSGIIVGQKGTLTPTKGFTLSSSYVLGMALAFAVAGLIVGLSGARIQIYMQDPIVLSVFATIFILLSLAMFGFYELQLPAAVRDRLNNLNAKQQGGDLVGVFIMGILSALVVSPCVSAPLAGVLIYIASEGSAVLGGLALFSLGLGMGAPLIAIGTTGANVLPKAGGWMDAVKGVFGVLLLGVAAWLIRTVLPGEIMMLVWAALLIIPAIYMGAFDAVGSDASGWQRLWKGVALMMTVYGAALIWGAAQGNSNPLKPLYNPTGTLYSTTDVNTRKAQADSGLIFETVTSDAELSTMMQLATQKNQPIMIDYYADWCIACVEMVHGAFADPRTSRKLNGFKLIKVDITEGGDEATKLLDRFSLIGPPSILFFDSNCQRLHSADIMGEMKTDRFLTHLEQQVLPVVQQP